MVDVVRVVRQGRRLKCALRFKFVQDRLRSFDNPLFAPLMVAGFVAWFGYDGWFNDDPEMLEHLAFNRYGFMALILLLGRLLLEDIG